MSLRMCGEKKRRKVTSPRMCRLCTGKEARYIIEDVWATGGEKAISQRMCRP